MKTAIFLYELFVAGLSAFLSFHFDVSLSVHILFFAFFFLGFNSVWAIMHITYNPINFAREMTLLFSFLLAFVIYFSLFLIINDFLLFIPLYGQLFFDCSACMLQTFAMIAALISLYAIFNASRIYVKRYQLKSDKPVQARIAFLSDLHVAPNNLTLSKVREILALLKDQKADFIILGGDMIEMRPDTFIEYALATYFKEFKTPHSIMAILGNHEYYGGQVDENIQALQNADILVLRDSIKDFPEKNITFIGRDDRINANRASLTDLMKKVPMGRYVVVVDHDPQSIPQTLKTPTDLQLSGHTHNGQMFPFNLFVRFLFANGYGYKKIQHLDTIVSSGVGTWGPVLRLGSQSEIVVISVNEEM